MLLGKPIHVYGLLSVHNVIVYFGFSSMKFDPVSCSELTNTGTAGSKQFCFLILFESLAFWDCISIPFVSMTACTKLLHGLKFIEIIRVKLCWRIADTCRFCIKTPSWYFIGILFQLCLMSLLLINCVVCTCMSFRLTSRIWTSYLSPVFMVLYRPTVYRVLTQLYNV